MAIKSILCIFDGSQDELRAASNALELAKIFKAQVRFLHISHDPNSYKDVYESSFVTTPELIKKVDQENKIRLKEAKKQVASLIKKHNIDTKKMVGSSASAKFINKTGYPNAIISSEGRASDIIVLGNDVKTTDNMRRYYVMAAVFNTGRPVLFLPLANNPKQNNWKDKVVSIAWDGSLESARAIYGALPILERAKSLNILTANEKKKESNTEAQNAMNEYFMAHGLKPHYITLDCKGSSVTKAISSKAKELKTDLLVMGSYGHSRFRELILGGFTLDMLENTDMPLLLAH
jgi:nucleotide-binding universal stress UspA family protein